MSEVQFTWHFQNDERMTYPETLDYLYTQLPMYQRIGAAAYKSDLENTLAICDLLGNPQNFFPSIHIAGTNGKGSTSHMLASILQEKGLKTGLYTSPHLIDFRERIRPAEVNEFLFRQGIILTHLSERKRTLEQHFLELLHDNS